MEQLIRFLNSLPLRNGMLVLAVFFGFIFIVWNAALWQPLQTKQNVIMEQIKTETSQIEAFKKEIEKIKAAKRPEIKDNLNSRVIKIQDNSDIIKNIINIKSNLKLMEFQTPAEKAITVPTTDPAQAGISLMQHDIIVKFQGTYFGTVNYLKTLEKLDMPFFWDKFSYKVTKYPYAEISLQLHTLTH
jgi:hypothetical protein